MRTLHITGYDAQSGELVFEKTLLADAVVLVRQVAGIPWADADLLGAYPLSSAQMAELAALIQAGPLPTQVNFFAEAYEDDAASRQQVA